MARSLRIGGDGMLCKNCGNIMTTKYEEKPVIGYKELHTCTACETRCERLIKGKKRAIPIPDRIIKEDWIVPTDYI